MITERIDAVTLIPEDWRKAELPAPKSVKIELTGKCNFRCAYCALRTREVQPKDDMDFELFKRITTQMRRAGVQEIGCFYLGESFMAPTLLVDAIHWLKQDLQFSYVFLTSNASIAFPDVVKQCMAAGLDSLKWSVNAADEEQFVKIMGVKPRLFRDALANIKAAWQERIAGGYKTGLYASSIRYDGEQQAKMENLLEQYVRPYVDQHYFLPLYGMSMRSEEIKRALGYTPTHGNAGRIDQQTGLPNRDPLPCWSVFCEGHVRSDGHMSACCFGSDNKFDVADLNTVSFMNGWNGEAMQKIRAAQLRTKQEGSCALKGTMCDVCMAY